MRHKLLLLLEISIALFAVYLIVAPFLPLLETPQILSTKDNSITFDELLDQESADSDSAVTDNTEEANLPNRLLIPAISLNVALIKSGSSKALDLGAWLKPESTTPGENGNVIITGHKFVYFSGVRPFYHLYLTPLQANIYIMLNNQIYHYRVNDNFVVYDYETWIEEISNDKPILTIYTCEGFNSNQRRVIRAEYIKDLPIQ